MIGYLHIQRGSSSSNFKIFESFNFSVVTFSTVGYGDDRHTILRSWDVKDFAPDCRQYLYLFHAGNKIHLKLVGEPWQQTYRRHAGNEIHHIQLQKSIFIDIEARALYLSQRPLVFDSVYRGQDVPAQSKIHKNCVSAKHKSWSWIQTVNEYLGIHSENTANYHQDIIIPFPL
ncbi:potassium channel subfamily T member 2 [Biomphalaria glabrata]|nr:potassium channel subfamily T member 2 [Biomphalaria glabrata]